MKRIKMPYLVVIVAAVVFLVAPTVQASNAEGTPGHGGVAVTFLWVAIVLIAAKCGF